MNTSSCSNVVIGPNLQTSAAWAPLGIRELSDRAPAVEWLWRGYLARGGVTLLTSQWKTGKTTLLSVLLSKMHGGGRVGDLEVAAGRAAIVTEEGPTHWRARGERLDFGPDAAFFCRPFAGKPSLAQWQAFVEHLCTIRAERGLDLVVIDTLASFLPEGAEYQADAMLAALRPLDRLTSEGAAVLLVHHPRKGTLRAGQASRGSGALSGYCDTLLEMMCVPGTRADDRRRRLFAYSRYEETPRELVLELSTDGRDYSGSHETIDLEWESGLATIRELLRERGRQMTRTMLRKAWPEGPEPSDATLWRWLDRGVNAGFLVRHGRGTAFEAFRYSLPGVETPWNDMDEVPLMSADKAMDQLREMLSERDEFERPTAPPPSRQGRAKKKK